MTPPQRFHENWGALDEYLKRYAPSLKVLHADAVSRKYICAHNTTQRTRDKWAKAYKAALAKDKVLQQSRMMCPFTVSARLDRLESDDDQIVVICGEQLRHNHEVGPRCLLHTELRKIETVLGELPDKHITDILKSLGHLRDGVVSRVGSSMARGIHFGEDDEMLLPDLEGEDREEKALKPPAPVESEEDEEMQALDGAGEEAHVETMINRLHAPAGPDVIDILKFALRLTPEHLARLLPSIPRLAVGKVVRVGIGSKTSVLSGIFSKADSSSLMNRLPNFVVIDADSDNEDVSGIQLADHGFVTEGQLGAMRALHILPDQLDRVMQLLDWLDASDLLNMDGFQEVRARLKTANPASSIARHLHTELKACELYRVKPGVWASGTILEALGVSWVRSYGVGRSMMVSVPSIDGNAVPCIQKETYRRVGEAVATVNNENGLVFIPANINEGHWAGIVISKADKRFCVYDSLSKNNAAVETYAIELRYLLELDDDFDIETIEGPKQGDGSSCGYFVARFMWRYLDDSICDSADSARFRFRVLKALLLV
jgi:hypothetical protein